MDSTVCARITNHLNEDHPDAVQAIVASHLRADRLPRRARVSAFDASGFDVEYLPALRSFSSAERSGNKAYRTTRVPLPRVVANPTEARQAIVEMSQSATAKKYPVHYAVPHDLVPSVLLYAAIGLASLDPAATPSLPSLASSLLRAIHAHVASPQTAGFLFKSIVAAHVVEATLMASYVRLWRAADALTTAKWAVTQFLVGFPTYFNFHKLNPSLAKKPQGGVRRTRTAQDKSH